MYRALALSSVFLTLSVAGANAPQDEILIGGNFRVEIAAAPSCDAVSVDVDPIEIEIHDVTQSPNSNWRLLRAGVPRFGEARFTFRVEDKNCNDDLRRWTREMVLQGDQARRSISVILFDRDGEEARRYTFKECYPVAFAPAGALQETNLPCPQCRKSPEVSELTVQIGSIDTSDSGGAKHDQFLVAKGFSVEIKGADSSADDSWLSVDGGAVEVETIDTTVGGDGSRKYIPGKAYVTELTLTGYMTKTRKSLLRWMQESAGGGDSRRDVVITVEGPRPHDPRPQFNYYDCLISRIEIPRLSAGSSDPVKERVVLRPERYNDPA